MPRSKGSEARQSPPGFKSYDTGLASRGLPERSRILIIRLRSIGDIVLLTPALHLLKSWRPDLVISVLVEARFRELLEGNPDVDEILFPGGGPSRLSRASARRWRSGEKVRGLR